MRTTIYLCAALLFGIARSASAQNTIAYTDGPPFTITTDTNSTLDLDRDGVADFTFGAVFVTPDAPFGTNLPGGEITGDFFITPLNYSSVLCTNGGVVIMPAGTAIGNFTQSNEVWNSSGTGGSLAFLGIAPGSPPVSTWYGPLAAPPAGRIFLGPSFDAHDWTALWMGPREIAD